MQEGDIWERIELTPNQCHTFTFLRCITNRAKTYYTFFTARLPNDFAWHIPDIANNSSGSVIFQNIKINFGHVDVC